MKRRAKGSGTLETRGKKHRAVKVIEGQRVYGTWRASRKQAEDDLPKLKERVFSKDEMPTLAEYTEDLLKTRYQKRLQQSTWETNETIWRTHLYRSRIGRMKVDKLKRRDVQGFIDSLDASPSWVRRIGAFVSKALNDAVVDGLIEVSPAFRLEYPDVPERENQTLAPQDMIRLLNPADRLGAMILVAALTGLRRGELCGLQWKDIKGNVLHVKRSLAALKGGNVIKAPKSKSSAKPIPLPTQALEAIMAQPRRSAFVFTANDGKPVDPSNLSRDWRRYADKNGLAGMRLHDLRGSYISGLVEIGTDIKTVQDLARHSDPRTTLKAYARARTAVKEEAVERLVGAITRQIDRQGVDTPQNSTLSA